MTCCSHGRQQSGSDLCDAIAAICTADCSARCGAVAKKKGTRKTAIKSKGAQDLEAKRKLSRLWVNVRLCVACASTLSKTDRSGGDVIGWSAWVDSIGERNGKESVAALSMQHTTGHFT